MIGKVQKVTQEQIGEPRPGQKEEEEEKKEGEEARAAHSNRYFYRWICS